MIERKHKSKFVRGVECQICHRVGSLQILGNYYRIRHYLKLVNGRPLFEYHRVDKTSIDRILANLKAKPDHPDLKDDLTNNHPDSKLNSNGSVNQNECKSEKVTQNFSRLGLC